MQNEPDSLYRLVFQKLQTGAFLHRHTGQSEDPFSLVDLNAKACQWLGLTEQEAYESVTGLRHIFLQPKEYPSEKEISRRLQLAWEGTAQEFRIPLLRTDGSIRWTHVTFYRIQAEGDLLLTTVREASDGEPTGETLDIVADEFRALADNLPLNVARWSPQGRYIYINPTHEKLLEKSLEEVIGTPIPDAHAFVKLTIAEVLKTGKPSLFVPQKIQTKEGKVLYHEVSVVPEFDDQGKITSLLGIGCDMTELYGIQESLLVQEQRFNNLLANAPDNIACFDTQGNILYISSSMLDSLQLQRTTVIGKRLDQVCSDAYAGRLQKILFEVIQTGINRQIEIPLNTYDGQRIHEILLVPETSTSGAIAGAIIFGRDITKRKRDKEELENYRKQLEALVHERTIELEKERDEARRASLAKGEFLASMSHEIRTPMNAILGLAKIMLRAEATPIQQEQLSKINAAGRHLLSVINDILDLSKIEAGKLKLESLPFKLEDVMENVQTFISGRANDKGILLKVETTDWPTMLYGDQTRLQQALLNYASNAIKFSNSGLVILRSMIEAESEDQLIVRFEVEDSGIGIDPEKIPRLFSAFEQADNSISRQYGGTGLGLAITRRIAELMGGKVGVQSARNVGSTFWFTAKLQRDPGSSLNGNAAVWVDIEQAIRDRHSGRTILVVDDDPLNREITEHLLRSCGLAVESAEDGASALQQIQANSYALVLMDMQMPIMDGLEATRQLRQMPSGEKIPVIAMTANVYEEDKRRCKEAGMNDYLMKPFEPDDMFGCILKWLDEADSRESSTPSSASG